MTNAKPARHGLLRWGLWPLACVLAFWAMCGSLSAAILGDDAQDNSTSAPVWKAIEERWYVLEINGGRAGWQRSLVETDGSQYRTTTEMRMSVGRGDQQGVEVTTLTVVRETGDEQLIDMSYTNRMASQETTTRWSVDGTSIVSVGTQGDREHREVHPLPTEPWLTPRAADRAFRQAIKNGESTLSFRTFDPSNGIEPVVVEARRDGERTIVHNGKDVAVQIWKTTSSVLPVEGTEYFDADGAMLRQEIEMGLGTVVTRLVDEAEAKRRVRDTERPELMIATFVTPSRPIPDSMQTTTATYRLKLKKGAMPELPSAGAQSVTVDDKSNAVEVHVDVNARTLASPEDADNPAYTANSPTVDAGDALVKKLAQRALRSKRNPDAMQKAEALRSFVFRHIARKDLGTAFASASETARTRTGDCTEHAVLLCALLRSEGIPARVASGLVYADAFAGSEDVFGWHMWTQALIDGAWVDFDATLPGSTRYNAAHILTGLSSLSDNAGSSEMASMVQLMGNLEIEVVEVSR